MYIYLKLQSWKDFLSIFLLKYTKSNSIKLREILVRYNYQKLKLNNISKICRY